MTYEELLRSVAEELGAERVSEAHLEEGPGSPDAAEKCTLCGEPLVGEHLRLVVGRGRARLCLDRPACCGRAVKAEEAKAILEAKRQEAVVAAVFEPRLDAAPPESEDASGFDGE